MFNKKTIKDIDLNNKRIIIRTDWNVPASNDGSVSDDFRIRMSRPTLEYLLKNGAAKVIIISHRGRPKNGYQNDLSMAKVAQKASQILGETVEFIDLDQNTAQNITTSKNRVFLLENLRFDPREKAGNPEFAKQLAELADIYVLDGFAVAHREDASVTGITQYLPSVSGLLVENEVEQVSAVVENPEKPVLAITGGSKLETKLPLLENFMKLADSIVVAGVMANTLLVAQGHNIGKSVYDADELDKAREVLKLAEDNNVKFVLPEYVATGKSLDDPNRVEKSLADIDDNDLILDFGQPSIDQVIGLINSAKTIIWNGPLGYYENPVFAAGSRQVAESIASTSARSVVGGGDTADVVNSLGLADKFTHVSTGGGASLELLAGHKLPGVEALMDKD